MTSFIKNFILSLLKRCPFLKNVPAFRDAGTVDAALKIITKAFDDLANVSKGHTLAADKMTQSIADLINARQSEIEGKGARHEFQISSQSF
jgi:hypothetical protein